MTQSAVETLPRMETTTLLVSWSSTTMYGSAPSACQHISSELEKGL